MFTMITDYRDTIEAINDKPKVVIAQRNGNWWKGFKLFRGIY
jgi:hypothetical protein